MDKLIRFLIPVVLLGITIFVNSLAGSLLILGYLLYMIYTLRSALFSKIGSRAFAMGDLPKAVEWYERAMKGRKPGAKVLLSLCLLYLKSGKFSEARELYGQVTDKESLSEYERGALETTEAVLCWKEGDIPRAKQLFPIALENFKNSTLYGCIGSFYLAIGDRDKAVQMTEEAYEFNNSNSLIKDNYARGLYEKGQREEALQIWDDMVEAGVALPEPYWNKARCLLEEKGDKDGARDVLIKGLPHTLSHISYLSREELDRLKEQLEL